MEKCNRRRTPEDNAKNLESTMENEQEVEGTKLKKKDVVGLSPSLGPPDDLNQSKALNYARGRQHQQNGLRAM